VTLIAAFRCDQGAVICADSQETVGDYRVAVDKIKPRDAGQYEIVIGGAGASGPLIDRFSLDLERAVAGWESGLAIEEIENHLGSLLQTFQSSHVKNSTYKSEEFAFLVCIKDKTQQRVDLWELRDTAVLPVETYSLIGWDEPLYKHEVGWLYRGTPSTAQAVQLGLRLFSMAKATSNYIGGPTQVIIARDNGVHLEDEKDIQELEERVEQFNEALADLVLACPDLSINQDAFRELLAVFRDTVLSLREYYLHSTAETMLGRALTDPNYKGDAYAKLPLGTIFKSGRTATKYKPSDSGNLITSKSVSPSPSPSPSASPSSSASPSASPEAAEDEDSQGAEG
jgi:hypothetical protein